MIQHTFEKRLIDNVLGVQTLIGVHSAQFGRNGDAERHKLIVRSGLLFAIVIVVNLTIVVVVIIIIVMPPKTPLRSLGINVGPA